MSDMEPNWRPMTEWTGKVDAVLEGTSNGHRQCVHHLPGRSVALFNVDFKPTRFYLIEPDPEPVEPLLDRLKGLREELKNDPNDRVFFYGDALDEVIKDLEARAYAESVAAAAKAARP